MIKQRRLRERTILTLIPMAMIVLGASPGRPLQIGRLSSASLARRARGAVARGVSGAGGVFHHRRTENKIRHVVHSDNFTEEPIARRAGGARARSDVMRGPWLENDVNSFHASLYGGAAVASAQRPLGLRQRTRMIKRGIMELAVRSVQFRNKFQWRPDRSNSFVDMNRSKLNNSRNDAIAVSDAANRSGKRISLRPLLSFFDRSRKITMETMDTMDVMGGDVNEVEYSKAMTVLSPSDIEIRADTSRATKVRVDKSTRGKWNPFRINLFKEKAIESAAMSSRGGAIATIVKSSASSQASIRTSTSTASISSTKSSSSSQTTSTILSTDTWVIETPLFPVILPKSWEPPTAIQSTAVQESITTTEVMEISVVIEQTEIVSKPSLQTLETATQPLIPKSAWASFQGNEFYYPESMELLAQTGLRMAVGNVEMVDWTGEKKTLKFLQDHGSSIASLTEALTSSQEILAWSGKFTADGQGSELPVIKTMAVIDKSPQCLAELLMDSSKVKVYNKMSLGRSDEEVFQSGINTVGGSFGDGESKVVRNLTKPPMVNNILEFITCMHARRLRPDDANLIPSDTGGDATKDGYIVVSRAVTGGKWAPVNNASSGDKFIRNEILSGVNLLQAIPGEPDKTKLTAVTHVYSPLVPLMLAKNAGMKGAVDFVRDVRAVS